MVSSSLCQEKKGKGSEVTGMGSGGDVEDMLKDEKNPPPLDEDDIALLKTYVSNPLSLSKP